MTSVILGAQLPKVDFDPPVFNNREIVEPIADIH